MADTPQVIYNFGAIGTVVDRKALNKVPSDQLLAVVGLTNTSTGPVKVVDDIASFFSLDGILAAVDNGDPENTLGLRLAKFDLPYTEDARGVIMGMAIFKAQLREAFAAFKPPVPPYNFASVPEGWSVETNLKITDRRDTQVVRRSNGASTHYVGVKSLERVWNKASVYWNGGKKPGFYDLTISAGGANRRVEFDRTSVRVGCQRIERYELEQVALYFGWDFPTK